MEHPEEREGNGFARSSDEPGFLRRAPSRAPRRQRQRPHPLNRPMASAVAMANRPVPLALPIGRFASNFPSERIAA